MSFAAPRLSIGKDSPVIAFSCCLNNLESCFIIDLLLSRLHVKHVIKAEGFGLGIV